MKINSIKYNQSFGRIIPVKSDTNPIAQLIYQPQIDYSTMQLSKVLNDKHSDLYTPGEETKIKNFFKQTLGDYNGKNGIVFKKLKNNTLVLLSGKDAQSIKKLEKEYEQKRAEINKRKNLNNNKKAKEKQNLNIKFLHKLNKQIMEKIEDGKDNRNESSFELTNTMLNPESLTKEQKQGHKPIISKFNILAYSSIVQTNNLMTDGHIIESNDINDDNQQINQVQDIIYDSQILTL